jgi:hypothetical protein
MSLRDTMLRSRIVGRSFQRSECPLTSHAAFQLLLHFLCAPLFERVRAAAQDQPGEREGDCEGLHPLSLWSADFIATKLKS